MLPWMRKVPDRKSGSGRRSFEEKWSKATEEGRQQTTIGGISFSPTVQVKTLGQTGGGQRRQTAMTYQPSWSSVGSPTGVHTMPASR